jgi:hypothetical protein
VVFMVFSKPDNAWPRQSRHYSISRRQVLTLSPPSCCARSATQTGRRHDMRGWAIGNGLPIRCRVAD